MNEKDLPKVSVPSLFFVSGVRYWKLVSDYRKALIRIRYLEHRLQIRNERSDGLNG